MYYGKDKILYRTIKADRLSSIILWGPPGCGKTKCAYLVAKQIYLTLIIARIVILISFYLGTTAKNIRALFEYAQTTPCVW